MGSRFFKQKRVLSFDIDWMHILGPDQRGRHNEPKERSQYKLSNIITHFYVVNINLHNDTGPSSNFIVS